MFSSRRSFSSSQRRSRRGFVFVLAGVLLVFGCRYVVNRTSVADWLVRPLLQADTTGRADAIVVPSAGVTLDCTPNRQSLQRVLYAVRAWRAQRGPVIVFSGGTPRDMECAVADVMAGFARELGVPSDRVRVETASRSTYENGTLSAPLLRALGASRVLVVTDALHMSRAAAVFSQLGFGVERLSVRVQDGHRDNTEMLYFGLREYAARAYYRAAGRIGGAPLSDPPATSIPEVGGSEMSAVSPRPDGPIVVLGASYAGGWKAESVAGIPVVNKGSTGQQSFELLARFDSDVVPQRPRAVLLWGFINDVFRTPRGEIEAAMDRAVKAFAEMIAKAKAEGIEPIVATEVTARPAKGLVSDLTAFAGRVLGKSSYQDYVNGYVRQTNVALRELARREGVLLADIETVLADSSGMKRRRYAADDGSHISAEGYEAIDRYLGALLTEHYRQR